MGPGAGKGLSGRPRPLGKAGKKGKEGLKGAIPGVGGGKGGSAGKKSKGVAKGGDKAAKGAAAGAGAAGEASGEAAEQAGKRSGRGAQAAQRANQRVVRGAQGAAGAGQQAAGSAGNAGRQAMGSAKQGAQEEGEGGVLGGSGTGKAVAGGAAVAAATTARYGWKAANTAQRAVRTTVRWTSRLIPLPVKVVMIIALVLILAIAGLALAGREIIDEEADEEYQAMMAWCQQQGGTLAGNDGNGGSDNGGGSETSGDQLSYLEIAVLADYGLRNGGGVEKPSIEQIQTATAITVPESSRNPNNHFDSPAHGDDSYGLWQTNLYESLGPPRRAWFGLQSDSDLFSPKVNAISMGAIWRERGYSLGLDSGSWGPWSTYNRDEHLSYMDEAGEAAREVYSMSERQKQERLDEIDTTVPPIENPTVTPSGDANFDPDGNDSSPDGDLADNRFHCGGDSGVQFVGDLSCPSDVSPWPSGSTPESFSEPDITAATQAMVDAVVPCFGNFDYLHCKRSGPPPGQQGGSYHNIGQACDFSLMTNGDYGHASGASRQQGDSLAEWAVANAEELDIITVIWYDEIWSGNDWTPYNGRASSPCGSTDANCRHTNHVHVSVGS